MYGHMRSVAATSGYNGTKGAIFGVLLTVVEVADVLKVSPRAVRRYIAQGKLRAVRFGRGYRVELAALEAFIRAAAVQVTPPPVREGLADVPGTRVNESLPPASAAGAAGAGDSAAMKRFKHKKRRKGRG